MTYTLSGAKKNIELLFDSQDFGRKKPVGI